MCDDSGWFHQQELEEQERIELDPEYRKEYEKWLDTQSRPKQTEDNSNA